MTELSENFNAQAARAMLRSPAVPTLIMVVGLAVTWVARGLTEGLMSRIAERLE